MQTIEAFDALVDSGVAVEFRFAAPGNQAVVDKSRVALQCSAMIWDGANTETQVYSEGVVKFTVGKNQVTAGLDEACLQLHVDEEADIICAPMMAYGDAGQPPVVPPNAHIVYSVKVISVSTDPAETDKPAEGDPLLFWTGISQRTTSTAAGSSVARKTGAVQLVTDGSKDKKDGTEITDDMLAKAAQGMGMK